MHQHLVLDPTPSSGMFLADGAWLNLADRLSATRGSVQVQCKRNWSRGLVGNERNARLSSVGIASCLFLGVLDRLCLLFVRSRYVGTVAFGIFILGVP